MYIVKNVLRNIMRSKGRNILVGIIIFVIAVSSCVALTIKQAAVKAENESMSLLNIKASISYDRTSQMKQAQGSGTDFREMINMSDSLELNELQTYAASQYVSDFYYTITSSVNSGDEAFAAIETSSISSSDTNVPDDMPDMGGGGRMTGDFGTQGDFTMIGYSSETAMTDFISGTCSITDGAIFDITAADMSCIITDELALYNDLEVGDTITIANPNAEDEVYTLTITGIYTNSESGTASSGMMFSASSDPANRIITSAGTVTAIAEQSSSVAETETNEDTGMTSTTALRSSLSGTYILSDTAAFEAFSEDVYTLGLDDTYTVSSSDITSYENSLVPLQNLSKFAGVFLLIVLLIGGIILVVLNIFNIRERKYEVGVLTAIGMKKPKVAIQFMCELFAVTMATIIIGSAIGAIISVPATVVKVGS
ncbi:MAG TPA: ABC transporter permease [Clostridiales bacterium]|nr:ABC transporter permease [Clostridiales bacterium]